MLRVPEATSGNRIFRVRKIPCFRGGNVLLETKENEKKFLRRFFVKIFTFPCIFFPFSLFYETRFIIFFSLIYLQSRFRSKLSKNHDNRVSTIYKHVIIGRHAFREKRKRRRPAAVLSNAKLQRQVSRRWQNIERTCDPSTN